MARVKKKKPKTIYTLTTVGECDKIDRNGKAYRTTRSVCVGWFSSRAVARRHALENNFDAGEAGYYEFIVLEATVEGIYRFDTAPEWFRIPKHPAFCGPTMKIETPKKWKNIVGWWQG